MELDAEVEMVLERLAAFGRPSLQERPLADSRADHDADAVWVSGAGQEVAHVEDRALAGPDGPIPVRVYRPEGERPLPLVAYFHGGGWVLGSIDSFDGVCRALANASGAVVVSVGYRLAPEHPFPASADDAFAAVAWLADHGDELGGDPARLAVAGDSAGANLAIVAARRARDAGGPAIGFQALVYPVADCHREDEDEAMRWMWRSYLGDDPESTDTDPDAVPLRADLAGLPPALVLLAEFDPLRADGESYAGGLEDAGVEVETRLVPGTTHGFWRWLALCGVARRTVDDVGNAIREGLRENEIEHTATSGAGDCSLQHGSTSLERALPASPIRRL